MKLEKLKKYLGKFDGYAISTLSDTLAYRTKHLEDCIQNAICLSEEDCDAGEYRSIEIWSVESVTVKSIAPSGETIIDHMWDEMQFDDFMEDVTASQKKSLNAKIVEAISKWIEEEKINFDYYIGIKSKDFSYEELLQMEKEIDRKVEC